MNAQKALWCLYFALMALWFFADGWWSLAFAVGALCVCLAGILEVFARLGKKMS